MTVKELTNVLKTENLLVDYISSGKECCINSITYNSKEVLKNSVFACKGLSFKEEYLHEAVMSGACAYMSEKKYDEECDAIIVKDIRAAMSAVARNFYNFPERAFHLIGITGTKGKTTTTYFLKNIFDEFTKKQNAIITTVEIFTGKDHHSSAITTPEAFELQKTLAEIRENGVEFAVMEVSSQAYKTNRVYGIEFEIGMFLNFGEDHISTHEHPSMEDYLECKTQLFEHCKTAIINGDDPMGEHMAQRAMEHGKRVIFFGSDNKFDYVISNVVHSEELLKFDISDKRRKTTDTYEIALHGRFNAENAAAAVSVAKEMGIDSKSIAAGLIKTLVPGRMNVFSREGITVIVDYAHNELSLDNMYKAIKEEFPSSRIIAVAGCSGGKAMHRRRDVGACANRYASKIYITASDPNFEDPYNICRQIAEHVTDIPYEIIIDRQTAIETAISNACVGDVIVITGKGERCYQRINGVLTPYPSDLVLAERFASGSYNLNH